VEDKQRLIVTRLNGLYEANDRHLEKHCLAVQQASAQVSLWCHLFTAIKVGITVGQQCVQVKTVILLGLDKDACAQMDLRK